MSGQALNGHCLPFTSDTHILDIFNISPSYRRFKDIHTVLWKTPTLPYIKVNTDGSLRNNNAACGGICPDQTSAFMSSFSAFLGIISLLEAKIMGFIIAMEMAARHQWRYIWIEGDSTSNILRESEISGMISNFVNDFDSLLGTILDFDVSSFTCMDIVLPKAQNFLTSDLLSKGIQDMEVKFDMTTRHIRQIHSVCKQHMLGIFF